MTGCMNDIFSPNVCEAQWQACVTDEQIHVFLWQQIAKLKTFSCDFYNDYLDKYGKLSSQVEKNSGTITEMGKTLKMLQDWNNQQTKDMQQLRTDFNNSAANVERTLNLYQSTINEFGKNLSALQASDQALQNRVGVLEKQTDINKLNEIIKSYEQIKDQTKQIITDYVNSRIWKSSDGVPTSEDGKLITVYEAAQMIDKYGADFDKRINDQVTEYNEFQARINKTVTDNEIWMKEQVSNLGQSIKTLDTKVDSNYTDLSKQINDNKSTSSSEISRLETKVDNNYGEFKHFQDDVSKQFDKIDKSLSDIYQDLSKQNTDLDSKFMNEIKVLADSDVRQWDTINVLGASVNNIVDDNKDINKHLTDIETKYDTQIKKIDKRTNVAFLKVIDFKEGEMGRYSFDGVRVSVYGVSETEGRISINGGGQYQIYRSNGEEIEDAAVTYDPILPENRQKIIYVWDIENKLITPRKFYFKYTKNTNKIQITLEEGGTKAEYDEIPEPIEL